MYSLPLYLLNLLYGSTVAATIALVFTALNIRDTPATCVVPIVFALTVPYHVVTIVFAHFDKQRFARMFSALKVAWAFIMVAAWMGCFGVLVTFTVLQGLGKVPHSNRMGLWAMIISTVTSLVESMLLGCIAFISRKERMRLRYAAKWKFSESFGSSQTWSISRTATGS